MATEVVIWNNTKQAFKELKELLICSLCSQLVEKPNVLGGCQHFYCKRCVDDYLIGEACPQCGMPSHARDLMLNRQLSTAVLLVRQLDTLLTPPCTGVESEENESRLTEQNETVKKRRHSVPPKDRKIADNKENKESAAKLGKKRTNLEPAKKTSGGKVLEARLAKKSKGEALNAEANANSERPPTRSLRNHTHNECPSPTRSLRNRTHNSAAAVQGIDRGQGTREPEGTCTSPESTCSTGTSSRPSASVCATRRKRRSTDVATNVTAARGVEGRSPSTGRDHPRAGVSKPVRSSPSTGGGHPRAGVSKPVRSSPGTGVGHPRAGVAKPQMSSPRSAAGATSSKASTPQSRARGARSANTTPSSGRLRRQPWLSPSSGTPRSGGFVSPGSRGASPHAVKKNARGETALHLACIKGDIEAVKQLIDEDAAINVKDHAGWTPLHEAVNHGHVAIAEILLDNGAFINIPGLDNDTPLHDAVQNGRQACVRLLVKRGANKQARNINGKTPGDLAKTKAVRDALAVTAHQASVNETLSQGSYPAYNQVVVLPTGLSRDQKSLVAKCASMLRGRVVHEFCPAVTHVVTSVNQDGQCPRTIKYMQAVLTGKWVLTLQWIETCLEYSRHLPEEAFEVPGASSSPNSQAPQRARINCQQQLPGLFDGCQFYFHGDISYPLPEKTELMDLVRLGGGTILNREPKLDNIDAQSHMVPYHARTGSALENCGYFVVNDGKGVRSEMIGQKLCWTKASWVLNCIAQFDLLELEK